jgi:hypothetical protein
MKLIQDIINALDGPTGAALDRGQKLKEIEAAINVDDTAGIKVHGIKGNKLLLSVSHAGFATQLQYRQFAVLSRLHHAGLIANVNGIKVQVRPEHFRKMPKPRQPAPISATSRAHLMVQSETLSGSDLGRIFRRLSEREN